MKLYSLSVHNFISIVQRNFIVVKLVYLPLFEKKISRNEIIENVRLNKTFEMKEIKLKKFTELYFLKLPSSENLCNNYANYE